MVDKRQESNKRIAFSLGPVSAVADVEDATLAELGTLTNVSEATKWDGFDFNLEASAQDDIEQFEPPHRRKEQQRWPERSEPLVATAAAGARRGRGHRHDIGQR